MEKALPGIPCHLGSPCLTAATASGVAAKATNISAERLQFGFAIFTPAEDLGLLPVMSK